jgi:nicotinate phosphoribosyltransferase
MKKFFSATDDDILKGRTTDIYFIRTMEILRAKRMLKQQALAEFTVGGLPRAWPWGVFCGVEEVVRLFEGRPVDLWGLPEGTVFRAKTSTGVRVPVMTLEGAYSEYCLQETPALGFMCHSSGVATMAARTKMAAGERTVLSFGIRRMHPSISPMLDRSSFIGGCDSVSSLLGAEVIGEEPSGTMPHALIIMFEDQRLAFKAFDEVIDPKVDRVALVDTYSDEKAEALMACEAIEDLYAIRLDTPGSRRGSLPDLIREVRWEMDLRGFHKVKIFVSGGLDDKSIPELAAAGAEGFGVGTSISNAPTIDFALDIVEKDGRPVAKRGKFSGRKHPYRCRDCLTYEVSTHLDQVPECPCCGAEMELAEVKLLERGKRKFKAEEPSQVRARVLEQLARLEP